MYIVDKSAWIKVAVMFFDGAAGRWYQSVEKKLHGVDWGEFCKLIQDRFGRDQHKLLIRQLFHVKQTGSVADYVDRFAALVDQLAAYTTTTDPLYYTMRFIDGLRDDIKSIVLVQRLSDLDTACTLARLQEEVGDFRRREYCKPDAYSSSKPATKGPLPLPVPPHAPRSGVATTNARLRYNSMPFSNCGSCSNWRMLLLKPKQLSLHTLNSCSWQFRRQQSQVPLLLLL